MLINIPQIIASFVFNKIIGSAQNHLKFNPLPIKEQLKKDSIRVSISYLHKIAIKDKDDITQYLLVKNNRITMFQPPGGVYKYNDNRVLEQLKAREDKNFHGKKDLRIRLPKNKVGAFLDKFSDNKWREVGFDREFKEELLDTRILPLTLFDKVEYRFIERRNSGLRFSDYFRCEEINFYDIVEVCLTEIQTDFLLELLNKSPTEKYIFATEEAIIRQGFDPQKNNDPVRISEHSKQIL